MSYNHHDAVAYPKGSILFEQDSPAGLIFLLMSGVVKIYCPMGNIDRAFLRLTAPGEILGLADFMDSTGQGTRAFKAQALTKCVVALFTREHVAKMLEELDQATLVRLLEHLNTPGRRFCTGPLFSLVRRSDSVWRSRLKILRADSELNKSAECFCQ
jgi:CRP-like cAMP-binding protein